MSDFNQGPGGTANLPPNGWAASAEPGPERDALAGLAEAISSVVPDDLTARIAQAVRDLLSALKALLEWLIDHLGGRVTDSPAPQVRDIPLS